MLNSSSTHHTDNMKLLLLTVACFAAALAAPTESTKRKRDILPGDPRYGTDYHHQHHHAHHDNEIQVSKSVGGYVGSYAVPDSISHSTLYQVPQTGYGPPDHIPGPTINNDYLPPTKTVEKSVISFGAPVQISGQLPVVQENTVVEEVKKTVQVPATSYGTPVTKTTVHTVSNNYVTPTVDAPVASYETPAPAVVDVKSQENVETPVTSYGIPVKTSVESNHEDTVQKAQAVHQTEVRTHVEETKTVHKPEVKATFPAVPQGVFQQTVSSVPLTSNFGVHQTSFGSSLGSSSFDNFKDFSSGLSGFDTSAYSGLSSSSLSSGVYGGAANYGFNVHPSYQTADLKTYTHVPQTYGQVHEHVSVPLTQPISLPVRQQTYVHVAQPYSVSVNSHVPSVHVPQYQVPVQHQVQRGPVTDFFENNVPNFPSLPSFPSIPNFPSLPSLPSLPSFPSSFSIFPSVNPNKVTSVVQAADTPVTISHDTVTVENTKVKTPVATKTVTVESTEVKTPAVTKTVSTPTVTKVREYVQPTDANGGYIY